VPPADIACTCSRSATHIRPREDAIHDTRGRIGAGAGAGHLAARRSPQRRGQEIAALQLGIDLGLTLIDTAEMYGDGAAEELVAEAIVGRRDQVFLVTKVLPGNASSRKKLVAACERSLRRLRVDHIDLYLLHWRQKKISRGASRPSRARTAERSATGASATSTCRTCRNSHRLPVAAAVASDQVLYNVSRRGIEFNLLPAARQRGLNVMAYTPIEQGRILGNAALRDIRGRPPRDAAQVALAWVIRQDGWSAIPRTGSPAHVRENAGALASTCRRGTWRRSIVPFRLPPGPLHSKCSEGRGRLPSAASRHWNLTHASTFVIAALPDVRDSRGLRRQDAAPAARPPPPHAAPASTPRRRCRRCSQRGAVARACGAPGAPASTVIGPANAPVTLVEFLDPACGACAAFSPVVKQIQLLYPRKFAWWCASRPSTGIRPGDPPARGLEGTGQVRAGAGRAVRAAGRVGLAPGAQHSPHRQDRHRRGRGPREGAGRCRIAAATAVLQQDNEDIVALKVERTPTFT
jgi:diketogulonate reductase-like aldo/keto reductase